MDLRMVNNTEALIIAIMGVYTAIIVFGIHRYEAKIKNYEAKVKSLKQEIIKWYSQAEENNQNLQNLIAGFQDVHNHNEALVAQIAELRGMNTSLDKLNDTWAKGGMGIVSVDIVKPE